MDSNDNKLKGIQLANEREQQITFKSKRINQITKLHEKINYKESQTNQNYGENLKIIKIKRKWTYQQWGVALN